MSSTTTSRWALRRGAAWVCSAGSTVILGPGSAESPVCLLRTFEQAQDLSWLLRATQGLSTEIRKV